MLYEVAYYSDFIYINVYSRYMYPAVGVGLFCLTPTKKSIHLFPKVRQRKTGSRLTRFCYHRYGSLQESPKPSNMAIFLPDTTFRSLNSE
jgi:hypothetical protein